MRLSGWINGSLKTLGRLKNWMSSAAVPVKTFRATRTPFRDRTKTIRLPAGITVRLQPGIPFVFTPESFSRSPRNPFRLAPESATTPMMRLQDEKQTKILLVTLAETTPVLEAANLQADLRRAGIEPWAWIINNSVAAAHHCPAFNPITGSLNIQLS
jgi:hypothetical protein